tara:strand:+ start:295 stop:825 length:531 start_codon:yes stop_codon:yes gene_type:complete
MQKLVIQTQYRENYAYPDWDGKGECPQAWKFKGGSTYVVNSFKDFNKVTEVMKQLDALITFGNEAAEEYILSWEIVPQSRKVCEDWETVTQLWLNPVGKWEALKITDNRPDEDGYGGYMRREILEKTESWTMAPENERLQYKAEFLMEDGEHALGDEGLKQWFIDKSYEYGRPEVS